MRGREVIIKDTHRGLRYRDGVMTGVLEAGRYKVPQQTALQAVLTAFPVWPICPAGKPDGSG